MQAVPHLLNYFTPNHYTLHLLFDRENRRFSGTVDIRGEVTTDKQSIILHSKDLSITAVLIDGKQAENTLEGDTLIISHPNLLRGTHLVTVRFEGTITDGMHGLYPCYYEHDGVKKELLATQFESHHAREVFPCIDEPEAKATFDVTLTTENNVTVLGNTPVKKQFTENNRTTTIFETTPRMSTYLLAWIQGELHKKTATTKGGVEVNIWATKAQAPNTLDFALEVATNTIDYLNDYFKIPYPLAKSDHVALPDFTAGAMENWGLITYRERALLADPVTTSLPSKQYIALVIAHELSHQWFGNLVTMRWWDTLWLNESFATLMEYVVIDALYPEWNIWLTFASTEAVAALQRDCIDGVQPVQTSVNHPDEINSLFDPAIVYAKGARLLRMLQHFIGHQAFQNGLREYFETHAYQNTEGADLWKALAKSSGQDVEALMEAWITQPGYPVVHVTSSAEGISLRQEQFFAGPHNPSSRLWPIPLEAAGLPQIFSQRETTVQGTPETSRFNQAFSSHFITHYSSDVFAHIVRELPKLSPVAQLQHLFEQQLLARGNTVSSATLLPLLHALSNTEEDAVWSVMQLAIRHLKHFAPPSSRAENQLQTFTSTIAAELYAKIGWLPRKDEKETVTKLRPIVTEFILYGNNADSIKEALQLYTSTPVAELNPEMRPIILETAVNHTEDAFSNLIATYKTTPLADLKTGLMIGLSSVRDSEKVQRLMGLLTNETFVRRQDLPVWFLHLVRNPYTRPFAWKWMRDNWQWIIEKFAGDKHYDTFPRNAALFLSTKTELAEYKEFFEPILKKPALSRIIELGINDIEGRVAIVEAQQTDVENALIKFNERR